MAGLQWQFTMSLDGFIAGPGGDMSWLVPYLGPDPAVDRVIEETGALLVGNRTFGGDDPHRGMEKEGEPYGGGWTGPQFVLTHDPSRPAIPGITFVGDLRAAVAAATAAAGGKYVGVLGAQVARQCLDAGLLDEIFVGIAPVLLGDGVRVFDRVGGPSVALERIGQDPAATATSLRFRVVR